MDLKRLCNINLIPVIFIVVFATWLVKVGPLNFVVGILILQYTKDFMLNF